MKRLFLDLIPILLILFTFTSCGSFFRPLKKGPPLQIQGRGDVIQAAMVPLPSETSVSELTRQISSFPYAQFLEKNNSMIIALMAHLVIWLLLRLYQGEKRRKYENLSTEDIALIKIIKDPDEIGAAFHGAGNAARIWENHRRGGKVAKLRDEGR